MKWQRKPPDSAGFWLRFNAARRTTLHRVFDEPNMGLITHWGGAEDVAIVSLDYPKLRGWLWFGPIPGPPDEDPYKPEEGDNDGDDGEDD